MGCPTSYVTADQVAEFFCRLNGYNAEDPPFEEDVDRYIEDGAALINAALAQRATCDCTFASWATTLLRQMNLIAAALAIICPGCGESFSKDQRQYWSEWMNDKLTLLRTGEIEVCDGATGPNFPAYGVAQQGLTSHVRAQIIANDVLANL